MRLCDDAMDQSVLATRRSFVLIWRCTGALVTMARMRSVARDTEPGDEACTLARCIL